MRKALLLFALALTGCAPLEPVVVDATPVIQGGEPLKALHSGVIVTGRNWNAAPSDSPGDPGNENAEK